MKNWEKMTRAELLSLLERADDTLGYLKRTYKRFTGTITGKIETMRPSFDVTPESIDKQIAYWEKQKEIIGRCQILRMDNMQTKICKAYILGNGREGEAAKILGLTSSLKQSQYGEIFLKTILPRTKEDYEAGYANVDKDILELAREIGRCRYPRDIMDIVIA